jgi:hypothetical protein
VSRIPDPLRELTVLTNDQRPAHEAGEPAAAWYAAIARSHERLAAQPGYDSARESALASWAYERSLALRRAAARI